MTIDEDMDSPVYLYFELSNFYQNHRRYVKSRNDNQLMSSSDATETDQCSPIDSGSDGTDSYPVYPCGLIAWSVFNDTIYAHDSTSGIDKYYQDRLLVRDEGASSCSSSTCSFITTTSDGIAWSSDKDDKFEKLSSCGGNRILDSSASPEITMPYNSYKYYMCSDGTSACSIGSTAVGDDSSVDHSTDTSCFDASAPSSATYGDSATAGAVQTTCELQERCADVSNEEFIVWMRTSGLPTFRKLYRVINTDLKKGETLVMTVNDVFPVSKFSGSKKIVLSTTAWIGGKNTFLGAAYITVACICILLGIGFLVKECAFKRKAGLEEKM
jgi:hypothetical protein